MRRNAATTLTAAILLAAATAPAGDWPHWRGPNLNGSTDETNLPASFSKTENIAWVVRTPGISGSTPIVLGERIYMTSPTYINDNLLAMCLSTRDGKTLWSKALGRGKAPPRGEMAASSPVVSSDMKVTKSAFAEKGTPSKSMLAPSALPATTSSSCSVPGWAQDTYWRRASGSPAMVSVTVRRSRPASRSPF